MLQQAPAQALHPPMELALALQYDSSSQLSLIMVKNFA
jgi:hypothetical protein